jgi:hypothetical protein
MSVQLTLVYPDNTTFLVGTFPSAQAVDQWVLTEQTRPYWKEGTVAQTQTIVDPVPIGPTPQQVARLTRLRAFTASTAFANLSAAQQQLLQDLVDHLLGK